AEARADEGAAKKIGAEESDEDDIVERTFVLEQRKAGDGAASRDREAFIAPIWRERALSEEGHLAEGERDHYEVDALGAQADDAGQERIKRRDRERDREGDQRIADPMRGENADGIGAEPDEGGVAERDQRAVADQEVERDRSNREYHHPRPQSEKMLATRHRRRRRQHRERQEDADRQDLEPSARRRWRCCKRKRRRHFSGLSPGTARMAGHRARPPLADRSASRRSPGPRCGR